MHEFFSITELVFSVCEELRLTARGTLVSLGATCRGIHEVAQTVLWREPGGDGLLALCQILIDGAQQAHTKTTLRIGSGGQDEDDKTKTSTPSYVRRFRLYADKVRTLGISYFHRDIVDAALGIFFDVAGAAASPFPLLRSLEISMVFPSDFSLVECLVNKNIDRLEINFIGTVDGTIWEVQTGLVRLMRDRLRRLERLYVTFPRGWDGIPEEVPTWAFDETLELLPYLKDFTLLSPSIDFGPVLAIGLSPKSQLKALTLHTLQAPQEEDEITLAGFASADVILFTNMRALNLGTSIGAANKLLSHMLCSPIETLHLYLSMETRNARQMSSEGELDFQLLDSLAHYIAHFGMLSELIGRITTTPASTTLGVWHDPEEGEISTNASPFPWRYLRHLYRCPGLTSFDFFFDLPTQIKLDDQDISDMANAWPKLELLWIRWDRSTRGGLFNEASLTVSGLRPLAVNCPNLDCLRLSGLSAQDLATMSTTTTAAVPLRRQNTLYPDGASRTREYLDKVSSVLSSMWPDRLMNADFRRNGSDEWWMHWARYPDLIRVIVEEIHGCP